MSRHRPTAFWKVLSPVFLLNTQLFTAGAVYMILLNTGFYSQVDSYMKTFIYGFAYFLIYTTPIQALFLLWIGGLIATSDHTWFSLSTGIFLRENIPFLYHWVYSWFWNAWMDFWWGFPACILGTLKLIANTLIGIWLLRLARAMD
ncbi:uncharacterized protein METZ01_LOCUS312754 [marine metagenome]|uniref:Uncharacterized protein n=1 Tax=marine metagenome TaxID=408172 RepID=A0A382NGR8_9ZZZZ